MKRGLRLARLLARAWLALSLGSGAASASSEKGDRSSVSTPEFVPRSAIRKSGRFIESGIRIENGDHGLTVAKELFSSAGKLSALSVPEHLGGGFLFSQSLVVSGSQVTALYRAETWAGKLKPLARLPFSVQRIEPGFDRFYVLGVAMQIALDPDSGQILPLSPLPDVVAITELSFLDSHRALVSAPVEGVLYSNDSGRSWMRIAEAISIEFDALGAELYVRTASGRKRVAFEGALTAPRPGAQVSSTPTALPRRALLSGKRPDRDQSETEFESSDARGRALSKLIEDGVLVGGESLAIHEGNLLSLARSQFLSLKVSPTKVPRSYSCRGISSARHKSESASTLFLCQGEETRVYRFRSELNAQMPRVDLLYRFGSRQAVAAAQGAILLSGGCGRRVDADEWCLVTASAKKVLKRPKSWKERGPGQALAVSEGLVSEIRLDTKKMKFFVTPLFSTQKRRKKSYSLPEDRAVVEIVRGGSLLPEASVTDEGLTLWGVRKEKFVGIRLSDGKEPSFGAIQRPLRRAIFDGPRAVLWGAAGFAKQSTDGGITFREFAYPYRSEDPELAFADSSHDAVSMSCSTVGCVLGRFFRLGFELGDLRAVALPEPTLSPPLGAARLNFSCRQGQFVSPARKRTKAGELPPFWESDAPAPGAGEEDATVAFLHDTARLYAWGPKAGLWGSSGETVLRFVNRWDPTNVLSTLFTPRLFENSLEAQAALGNLSRSTGVQTVAFDPGGRAGVFVLRTRQSSDVFTFSQRAPLERFSGAQEIGLRNLTSSVRVKGRFYAGFQRGGTLSVVQLDSGRLKVIATLQMGEATTRGPKLVRTARGDLGVSIPGDRGFFIYPLTDEGALGAPVVLPPAKTRPSACEPGASGFLVEREMTLAPYLETPTGRPIQVTGIHERLIVGPTGACLDGLTARTRASVPAVPGPAGPNEVPLSVLNADSSGNRMQLLCH